MGGITLRLALVGLVGSARGFELSEPLAGLACDSDADGESLELGHRQLDVSTPNWLQAGKELCAEECEQIAGCTTFHVMQSNGCIDEVGPEVCVPWAECTFFSRCEALEKSDEDWMDYSTSTAYFLTDRTAAPEVPSMGDRRQMYAEQNGEEVCEKKGYNPTECAAIGCCQFDDGECWSAVGRGSCSGGGAAMSSMGITMADNMASLSMPVTMPPGYTMTSMGNVFHGNSLADVMPPVVPPVMPQTPAPEEGSGTMPPPLPETSPPPPSASPSAPPSPLLAPPSPQTPGTTFEEKPAKQFKITVTFAGTVETFDKVAYGTGMRKILSCYEPQCKVAIAVEAASVKVETTVTDTNTDTTDNAVAKAEELKALSVTELQNAIAAEVPDVVVETTATVTEPIDTTLSVPVPASPSSPPPPSPLAPPSTDQNVEDTDSKQSTNEALGAGLGLGLGLPLLCMFLFCIHVHLNFPAEMRGKYLKWRFSHTNPRCCGYFPKERRDALWAEIKGDSSNRVSDRETAVEIPMPKAKAEDKKEVI
jgi:hypothetical protein